MESKGFIHFEIIIRTFLILSVWGSTLYVRIRRSQCSRSGVYRRQILTYKDDPCLKGLILLALVWFKWYKCKYSTDFTKWDRFFISGWPALTLASPSLARAQARRDRRRIGCAQRMKWARAPTRFGPGKYTRPNSTWACTQYTVWRLTWMLWTMCHLAVLARLALGKTGRAQLDHIQHHLNSSKRWSKRAIIECPYVYTCRPVAVLIYFCLAI